MADSASFTQSSVELADIKVVPLGERKQALLRTWTDVCVFAELLKGVLVIMLFFRYFSFPSTPAAATRNTTHTGAGQGVRPHTKY